MRSATIQIGRCFRHVILSFCVSPDLGVKEIDTNTFERCRLVCPSGCEFIEWSSRMKHCNFSSQVSAWGFQRKVFRAEPTGDICVRTVSGEIDRVSARGLRAAFGSFCRIDRITASISSRWVFHRGYVRLLKGIHFARYCSMFSAFLKWCPAAPRKCVHRHAGNDRRTVRLESATCTITLTTCPRCAYESLFASERFDVVSFDAVDQSSQATSRAGARRILSDIMRDLTARSQRVSPFTTPSKHANLRATILLYTIAQMCSSYGECPRIALRLQMQFDSQEKWRKLWIDQNAAVCFQSLLYLTGARKIKHFIRILRFENTWTVFKKNQVNL
jgi:hypothetical protein